MRSNFSYEKVDDNHFFVYSADKVCEVVQNEKNAHIYTKNVDYFANFFDLDENYANFKEKLQKYDEIKDALKYGYGIRILRQDIFEMFVSFVISANNNIPRIKIQSNICENTRAKTWEVFMHFRHSQNLLKRC